MSPQRPSTPKIDWKAFEESVAAAAESAVRALMDKGKGTFYAVAFHEFYAEAHDVIAMPCLAANTVESLSGNEDSRWSSADWRWTQIKYLTPEIKKLHRAIETIAASRDILFWEKTYRRFMDAFVKIVKLMQARLKGHPKTQGDFGVYVFTEEDEIEVLQRCMTSAKFKRLFPNLQADLADQHELQKGSAEIRLQKYQQDIWEYREEIVLLGALALPMLLEALNDSEQSWAAANCLGQIGIAEPEVIQSLRKRAKKGTEIHFHDAIALAMLGDVDFVLKLADQAKTRAVAIRGITSLYSCMLNWALHPKPLDYRPVERLLEKSSCRALVKELFSGPCEINLADVDEALRGLKSKHAVIREHAVIVLGERNLGKQSERILPAIADLLQDRAANVRRLTIIALSRWKKAARPYVAEIRKLFKDPDPDVASAATHYARELA